MRSIYRHWKLKIDVNSSITSDNFSDTDYHSDASSLSVVEANTIATTKASWGENIFGESDSDISNCITDSSIDLDNSSCISSLFSEFNENDKELAFASLDQFLLSESDSESSNNLSSLESIDLMTTVAMNMMIGSILMSLMRVRIHFILISYSYYD